MHVVNNGLVSEFVPNLHVHRVIIFGANLGCRPLWRGCLCGKHWAGCRAGKAPGNWPHSPDWRPGSLHQPSCQTEEGTRKETWWWGLQVFQISTLSHNLMLIQAPVHQEVRVPRGSVINNSARPPALPFYTCHLTRQRQTGLCPITSSWKKSQTRRHWKKEGNVIHKPKTQILTISLLKCWITARDVFVHQSWLATFQTSQNALRGDGGSLWCIYTE